MPRRPGIFQALGNRVMYGRHGVPGMPTIGESASFIPMEYPIPPTYPTLEQVLSFRIPAVSHTPAINPAIREAEIKEVKETKEQAEKSSHKGKRNAYVPEWGSWLTKQEVVDRFKKYREGILKSNSGKTGKEMEELLKNLAREEFAVMKQYNLSKHEPLDYAPGKFGGMSAPNKSATIFYYGGLGKNEKGWVNMSPDEQDAFMVEDINKTAPLKEARRVHAKNAEEKNKKEAENREYERKAALRKAHWESLSPAERSVLTYNRQLADYNDAVERNQYLSMMPRQQDEGYMPQMLEFSPVMLNDLAQMTQDQQLRYVPIKPRKSINEKVMSSFDPRLFSPEFIPEEENGY